MFVFAGFRQNRAFFLAEKSNKIMRVLMLYLQHGLNVIREGLTQQDLQLAWVKHFKRALCGHATWRLHILRTFYHTHNNINN
jgi:hypothetical protein